MVAEGWLDVPVGRDAEGWLTVRTQRTVLAVVHTVAGVRHIIDAVELLECDYRIQVIFTQAPDVFSNGVSAFLDRLNAVVIPWEQAVATDFSLALASDIGGVYSLHAPTLLLSHGVMNNKLAPTVLAGPDNDLVVGLATPWLTRFGKLVPAAVALSHDDLMDVLAKQCSEAVPVATVVGDLCLDRLVASRTHSRRYRRGLGIEQEQILVAVSSTWGPHSLLGRWRAPFYEIVAQLPAEHKAVAVMHPAIWFGHGPRQVMGWLAKARQYGLRIVEPTDWRAVIAAADVLIGDHGSATLYAAASGVPVLRTEVAPDEVKIGSAGARLAQVAPRLSTDRPLVDQLGETMKEFPPSGHGAIGERITSRPRRGAQLLRSLMYQMLALPEPSADAQAGPVDAAVTLI